MTLDDLIYSQSKSILIPGSLLKLSQNALRVYMVAYMLEDSKNGDAFRMPAHGEMESLCGLSVKTLNAAYHELHDTGLLRQLDNGTRKSMRKLVQLKRVVNEEVVKTSEGLMLNPGEKLVVKPREGKSPIMYNTVKFQPSDFLKHTLKVSQKRDNNNNALKDFTIEELWEASNKAEELLIVHAIRETEAFDTTSQKLNNCLSFFISRFDSEGKLRANRKGKIPLAQTNQIQKSFLEKSTLPAKEPVSYPIYPTKEYGPDRIDDVCLRLNKRSQVLAGECPIPMLSLSFLEREGNEVKLSSVVKVLVKQKPGYWNVKWRLWEALKDGTAPRDWKTEAV